MRPRVIPVLLLDRSHRLVKTRGFADELYIGDPFNVIRIFNEKEVDEICVLDITASMDGRSPDLDFMRTLASECFMPMGYGGGIVSVQECEHLFKAGIEKVVIGQRATDGHFIRDLARNFGSQSVVVSLDVARTAEGFEVRTNRGTVCVSRDPAAYAQSLEEAGAGEIIVHDIDRDGGRRGYDGDLIALVSHAVGIPVIALGGAGERAHLRQGLEAGASAVASGSAFVFIGRLRAVLITYPTPEEIARDVLPLPEKGRS